MRSLLALILSTCQMTIMSSHFRYEHHGFIWFWHNSSINKKVLTNVCPNNMREGGKTSTCPPHCYPFQTSHYKSERSKVLERGKTHSYSQEGASKYRSQGTIEWLRWVGSYTDYMPICFVPWSMSGVPNTTRSRTHNLVFILAEACCTRCLSCDISKVQHREAEGLITAERSLHWFQTSIWLHSQKQNVGPPS
jgi:hypothetical protein